MRIGFTGIALCLAMVVGARAQQVPGVVIDHQPASTKEYVGSPSIVVAPNGDYVASHDCFGPGSTSTKSAVTRIFVSHDRGVTWTKVTEVNDQFWSNLFVLRRRIYLMGTTAEYGRIVIRDSDDNGATWSEAHYLTEDAGYHTAPVPVVIHDGRIYRAFEHHPTGPWGSFQAFVMWAPVDSDITKEANWSFSDRLSFPVGDKGDTWLEGNAVVGPNGSILDILRVNNASRVAILKLTDRTLKLDQFVDFPGGATKFTIRFDPISKLYWTLSNPALPGESLAVSSPASVRNTLALMSSPDLTHWTPREIVLHYPESRFHAFQYVDWQFDASDIIVASRTAFDDGIGGAHSFHDANYLTFHRIRGFRKSGRVQLTGKPLATAEVIPAQQMEKWMKATATDAAKSEAGVYAQAMGEYGSHRTMITTRVKTGEAEEHRDWSDIFVAVAGEATLVSGGHLKNPRTIGAGEQRGSGVDDGVSEPLKPGAVAHIDPGIPHQLIVPEGGSFTYFVVKIKRVAMHSLR
ncbi:sialidase family protein [Edaphobacter dinghuensis]|uniref:Sialidase domain-containing protein n=1 Tax=Edaphobacter dinghuensis TaxID=1560005 RepID=A0A917GZJ5_9BACT|nr:sialidase family protein [Edaphobacter dinghuensis]GGG62754.1 hypothetical protein GCM10011585_00230 [Edaphobacter dinghuensis]